MTRFAVCFSVVLLSCTAVAQVPAPTPPPVQMPVTTTSSPEIGQFQKIENSWDDAVNRRDQYGLELVLSPLFLDVAASGDISTRNQQLAYLLTTEDGGALVRVIAGEVAGHQGPGSTFTPITLVHATISPTAEMKLPWRPDFNALVYFLAGEGYAGEQLAPVRSGQLVVFGPGDYLQIGATRSQDSASPNVEVLVLGGLPIREPVVHYGPFVMNTKEEIAQAMQDYQAGRLGKIPAEAMPHRHASDVELPATPDKG